jgi:glycosyltransferase involved in cell wall biosynthesis
MNSDVTIVISNYNYARFLPACVESCLAQTFPCSIIVVDDASTDRSWETIVKYAKKFPSITGVRLQTNSRGNARGKNVGICLSQTDLVTCLDSDDLLLPESVRSRREALIQQEAFWVHAKAMFVRSIAGYQQIMKKNVESGIYGVFDRYKNEDLRSSNRSPQLYRCVEASTVLVSRCIYDKVGLYDEVLRWKIDREMWHRLITCRIKRYFLDQFVSVYRQHPQQVTKNRQVKNPRLVDRQFKQIIAARRHVNTSNTTFPQTYDFRAHIAEITGK